MSDDQHDNEAGSPVDDQEGEDPLKDIIQELAEQTEDLCHIHDHITRIIANLDIEEEWFSGYDEPGRGKFDLTSIVSMFLYQKARDFDQSDLERRLKGATFVYTRFDLECPPTQGAISYNWRNRFNVWERAVLKEAANRIRDICNEHDIIDTNEPALQPEDILDDDEIIAEEQIRGAVERATELGFEEFADLRASNIKYGLQAYFERQGYLNLAKAGTTTKRRRFARLSDRDEVPHGSSHNRTLKKVADPAPQTNLWDFTGRQTPEWKRIRDEVLPAFHAGVENILDEIASRDRTGLREPVDAAFDITTWPYWSSPFRDEEDVEWWEEPVEIEYDDGTTREVYPKEDYPEMVSGVKESHQRAYKFATLTIVAENTPLVIAIEPVRDKRQWEPDHLETRTRGELVDRLLEQAERHVDINKVFADREFDSYEVRHELDQHDTSYVIGKRKQADADKEAIEKTVEHETADVSVEQGTLTHEGETHDVSFIYVPKDTAKDKDDYIEGDYAIFTVNAHVDPDRAMGLAKLYRDRWMIENEYKTIKKHFLPTSASPDYRNRLLYFVIGVTLFNVWRLANFLLRDEVDVNLGEDPPILAGEIVELVGLCLFDPGD